MDPHFSLIPSLFQYWSDSFYDDQPGNKLEIRVGMTMKYEESKGSPVTDFTSV